MTRLPEPRLIASALLPLIALILLPAAPLRAQTNANWTFKILDDTDATARPGSTNAFGINDAAAAVGNYFVGSSSYWVYGFKYSGTYSNIAVNPGGCANAGDTLPTGINNAGEYDDPNFYQRPASASALPRPSGRLAVLLFGEPSDAIVGQTSHLDGLRTSSGTIFSEANSTAPTAGLLHSPGQMTWASSDSAPWVRKARRIQSLVG